MALSKTKPHPSPKPRLEQYTIPAETAAQILHTAAYVFNDIIGKTVLDLGCGTGRLAIGAALLGAKQAIGIDIDREAVKMARENAEKLGVSDKTQWINAEIDILHGSFDTVVQNPPFGVQKRKADRKFLQKSLELGHRIYSLHKSNINNKNVLKKLRGHKPTFIPSTPSPFLKKFIAEHGGEIKAVYATLMTVPYMFKFHRKPKHKFLVDLYVIERKTM